MTALGLHALQHRGPRKALPAQLLEAPLAERAAARSADLQRIADLGGDLVEQLLDRLAVVPDHHHSRVVGRRREEGVGGPALEPAEDIGVERADDQRRPLALPGELGGAVGAFRGSGRSAVLELLLQFLEKARVLFPAAKRALLSPSPASPPALGAASRPVAGLAASTPLCTR